jgi:hypothetical protein
MVDMALPWDFRPLRGERGTLERERHDRAGADA